jgi:hypothetical protein
VLIRGSLLSAKKRKAIMEHRESLLTKSASAMILIPILGMVGGLLYGAVRARIGRMDELGTIAMVVKSGFLGSVFGGLIGVAVATELWKSLTSLKRLLALVAVATVLLWALITLLRGLTASGVI